MSFDFRAAFSARNRCVDQAAASRVAADDERFHANSAKAAGDRAAEGAHLIRASFHDKEYAFCERLVRGMQEQIVAAHDEERRVKQPQSSEPVFRADQVSQAERMLQEARKRVEARYRRRGDEGRES